MISKEEAIQTVEDWTNVERMTMDSIDAVCLIGKIYASIGSCRECKFYKDSRKCPMASPEAMADTNYCYNFQRSE
jgi:hypothetical protein